MTASGSASLSVGACCDCTFPAFQPRSAIEVAFEFQQLDSIDNAKPVWLGTGTQWEAFRKSNTEEKFYHFPDVTEKERQLVANRAGMKTRKFPRGEIESCGGP